MRRLVLLTSAYVDLGDISRYIARQSANRQTGRRFANLLFEQCERLASLPGTLGRGRPELGRDIRSFAFRGYVIFFRYAGDVFEVINILEGHRDMSALFKDDN